MGPKVPKRGEDESFEDWIDRVNKGSSDASDCLPWIALILAIVIVLAVKFL